MIEFPDINNSMIHDFNIFYIYIYIYIFPRIKHLHLVRSQNQKRVTRLSPQKKKKKRVARLCDYQLQGSLNWGYHLTNIHLLFGTVSQPHKTDRSQIASFALLCWSTNFVQVQTILPIPIYGTYTYFLFLLIKLQVILTSALKNQFQKNFNITFMENVKSYQNINYYFFFFHKNFL